ncbi:hypothetical protein Goari_001466, partial [Gossypium aridum]|nr:hypothetical protein [Gossypium aridum]
REKLSSCFEKRTVYGNDVYSTKARFGGKNREISIDCKVNEDAKLCFRVDKKRVLQIKGLKWKLRGHERIEVADRVWIQVLWDVYNWLFNQGLNKGQAVFMFKFENEGFDNLEWDVSKEVVSPLKENKGEVWRQKSRCRFSMKGIEWRKMRKSLVSSGGSSSSSSVSMSPACSGGSSLVMGWASVEESELSNTPTGFFSLVYA